jgi:DNA helicase-2/ATP-dependent DNA helicase PcrA
MTTGVPGNFSGSRCPPPAGLVIQSSAASGPGSEKDIHDEEEECLFFVALSRARTHLYLYRSETIGATGQNRHPSPFLDPLGNVIVQEQHPVVLQRTILVDDDNNVIDLRALVVPTQLTARDMVDFEQCPRRYFYSHIFGLKGATRESAFLKTHRCLYAVIDHVRGVSAGTDLNEQVLLHKLNEAWQSHGPRGHAFENEYKVLADNLVRNLATLQQRISSRAREELALDLGTGRIVVIPDHLATLSDGIVLVRFVRTGKKGSSAPDDTIVGAYHESARRTFGNGSYKLEIAYLTDGATADLPMSSRMVQSRLKKLERYLDDINNRKFPTKPRDTTCPRCPHFFHLPCRSPCHTTVCLILV